MQSKREDIGLKLLQYTTHMIDIGIVVGVLFRALDLSSKLDCLRVG